MKGLFRALMIRGRMPWLLPVAHAARSLGYALYDLLGWLCVAPFLKRGPVRPDQVRRILIIRIDRIGDMVLSTPAFRAVRTRFPHATIHLLAQPYTRPVVEGLPSVDRVISYGMEPVPNDYDLAIALHPGIAVNRLAARSGAAWRIGYSGWGGSFYLTHAHPDDRARRVRHEVTSALEIAALAGCATDDTRLDIAVAPDNETAATRILLAHGIVDAKLLVAIHPGSSQSYIRWPAENFARLADSLVRDHGATALILSGPADSGPAGRVRAAMREHFVALDDLSLRDLIAIIKRCRLFIGNSTGPTHIAAALHVPTVAVFGPAHPLDGPASWRPWSDTAVAVTADTKCRRCRPGACPDFHCLNAVTVESVMRAARSLIPRSAT